MFAASAEHNGELLRGVLRCVAWTITVMGVFTLLSGGVNVISSALVIALGVLWLRVLGARGALPAALDELALLSDKDCRGCCRNCCSGMCRGEFDNIRGLAIAAICFGVVELIVYTFWLSLLAVVLGDNNYNSYGDSCYTGSSNSCTITCYGSYNSYCYVGGSYYYRASSEVAQWLFFAVGHTAVAAPLNITWGAITLQIIGVLTLESRSRAASPRANEGTSLLSHGQQPYAPQQYGYQQPPAQYHQPPLQYQQPASSEGAPEAYAAPGVPSFKSRMGADKSSVGDGK